MATQVIGLTAPSALATPTLRVFADGSDTQVSGSPFTLVEATNRKGYYEVSFTGTLAGLHQAVLYTGSSPIANGWVILENTSATFIVFADRGVNAAYLSEDRAAADNAEAFFDGTGYAGTNNVIPTVTTVTGSVGSVTGAVGSVTGDVGGNVTGSVGSIATGGITSGSFAAGAINNAAMSIDGSELTAIPWNAAWDTEVQSEVEDAIVVHRLDELLNADSDIDGAAPPTVGSVFHELLSKTAGSFTYDQTTDSLEALRDRGDAAWITATGFSTLDAAGVRAAVGLASANLDTQLGDLPTNSEFAARTLAAADYFDPATDTVATVTNVTNLHASAATAAELAKVPKSDSNVTWNATALASINAEADTALADFVATLPTNVANSLVSGTEFLAVDAFKPIWSVSGGTLTVKKPDGTTTAHTKTLATDAAADPIIGQS